MVIEAVTEIVRHILCDALGVIVIDVAGNSADEGNQHRACSRHACQGHRVFAEGKIAQPGQKFGQLVLPDHVIDDDFQRPRRGNAHGGFDEHGDKDDDQPPAIGPDEIEHETVHSFARCGNRITLSRIFRVWRCLVGGFLHIIKPLVILAG